MLNGAGLNATLDLGIVVNLDVAMEMVNMNVTWME